MDSRKNSVHLLVTKDVPLESQEKWLAMGNELATLTWKEDGCLCYTFVRNREVPTRFFIIEEWESQAHLDVHAASEHFQRLVPLMDAISTMPSIDFCTDQLTAERFPAKRAKILILYDSSTLCTEKMAALIGEGALLVDKTEVRIRAIPGPPNHWDKSPTERTPAHPDASFDDMYWADGLACGSPCNLGCISWRMKKFWDDFSQIGGWGSTDGKVGCSFSSQGGAGGGAEIVNQAMNAIMMNFGFACFGITDYVTFKQTMHYGATCAKAPREETDIMPCVRQGTRLAEMVGYYIMGRAELHPLKASRGKDLEKYGFPGIPPRSTPMEVLVAMNRAPFKGIAPVPKKKVLIFTRMEAYVHQSTAAAASWVHAACVERGWEGIVTDDQSLLEPPSTLTFDLIVFVNNSGEIFNPKSELLSAHIAAGRGVMGVHAALACFLNGEDASGLTIMKPTTDIFEKMFKAHFKNHPVVQTASVTLDLAAAQALGVVGVPATFAHTDEFFNFTQNPCLDDEVKVLAYVDEVRI
jgi:NAD(P)H dehydrogenase (quinone)